MPIGNEGVASANKNVYFSGRSVEILAHIREKRINLSGLLCRLLEDWYKNEAVKPDDTNSRVLTAAEVAKPQQKTKKLTTEAEIDAFIESRKTGGRGDYILPALRQRFIDELTSKGFATVKE